LKQINSNIYNPW